MNTEASARIYDAIIVGSGAGGSAAAYELVQRGLDVLLLEKGDELPIDGSTLDVRTVVHEGRFKSRETWRDARGMALRPEEYFNIGGKTRWYGAALLRYAEHEFEGDESHQCLDWPIRYRDLAAYYTTAERLLAVRRIEAEPGLARIVARLARGTMPWRTESLPMGLAAGIADDLREARHFDGFASIAALKSDACTAFLTRARENPKLTLMSGTAAVGLIAADGNPQRIGAVRVADGRVFRARSILLAAGALHTPRLVQRYLTESGLARSLPVAGSIGRNLKLHLLTAVVALSPVRQTDVIRKTTLLLSDALPHSSVQPLGFDGELISTLMPAFMPRAIARQLGDRAYGFFLQTEDGSHPDNRGSDTGAGEPPLLDYDAARLPAASREHRKLIAQVRSSLARAGLIAFSKRIGVEGTAHACGTMRTGRDPATSAVDADGRVHGLEGLYVVDGSILPRSSRVNPSLTIYAWSLRVADRLASALEQRNRVSATGSLELAS
jgi:choline dehydrogenase-like flavoprotein